MLPGRRSACDDPLVRNRSDAARLARPARKRPADAGRDRAAGRVGRACGPVSGARWAARMTPDEPPPRNAARRRSKHRRSCTASSSRAAPSPCFNCSPAWRCSSAGSSGSATTSSRSSRDWRRNRIAYLFVLPAVVAIFAVIVFPFFYNIVLSLSNMSLVALPGLAGRRPAELRRSAHRSRALDPACS